MYGSCNNSFSLAIKKENIFPEVIELFFAGIQVDFLSSLVSIDHTKREAVR